MELSSAHRLRSENDVFSALVRSIRGNMNFIDRLPGNGQDTLKVRVLATKLDLWIGFRLKKWNKVNTSLSWAELVPRTNTDLKLLEQLLSDALNNVTDEEYLNHHYMHMAKISYYIFRCLRAMDESLGISEPKADRDVVDSIEDAVKGFPFAAKGDGGSNTNAINNAIPPSPELDGSNTSVTDSAIPPSPELFIHYTISEDRTGAQDEQITRILAPLAQRSERSFASRRSEPQISQTDHTSSILQRLAEKPKGFDPRVFGR
jgi:hypothetical protein